jgi:hypothetical protein
MSNWQPPSRDEFPSYSQPPYTQPPYSQPPFGQSPFPSGPPRKSGAGKVLLVIALLGVVAAVGAGVAVVVSIIPNNGLPFFSDPAIDPQDVDWSEFETPDERRRDLAAGFGAERVGVSGRVLRGIEQFLDELVAVCSTADEG